MPVAGALNASPPTQMSFVPIGHESGPSFLSRHALTILAPGSTVDALLSAKVRWATSFPVYGASPLLMLLPATGLVGGAAAALLPTAVTNDFAADCATFPRDSWIARSTSLCSSICCSSTTPCLGVALCDSDVVAVVADVDDDDEAGGAGGCAAHEPVTPCMRSRWCWWC